MVGSTNMCDKAGGLAMDQFDQAPSGIRAQYPGALAMLTVMYDRVQAVCEVRTCVVTSTFLYMYAYACALPGVHPSSCVLVRIC